MKPIRSNDKSEEYKDVCVGVDIGKSKIAAALVSRKGQLLHGVRVPTNMEKGGVAILEQCKGLITELLSFSPVTVRGIGVGSSGVVDAERGRIISSGSIPNWQDIDLVDMLQTEFSLPAAIENDVNAAGLGEYHFGAGKDVRVSVFMIIGTGVGFCTIVDGKLWKGQHNLAGQIAFLPLVDKKTVNDVFSGRGIARRACEIPGTRSDITTKDVFELASKGDMAATNIYKEALVGSSRVVAWIQNTLDPDMIILGGGVILNELGFFNMLKTQADENLSKYSKQLPKGIDLQLAVLGDKAGVIGAASLVMF